MNKIKSLLEKAGCKPELTTAICEAIDNHKVELRAQFESEFKNKIEQAKKVCLEETANHKRELARRVQVFCETKSAAIDAQLAKQSAHSESASSAKLREMRSLLEGVELNGAQNRTATVATAKFQQVNEEKDRAVEKANKCMAVAERTLKENRKLANELNALKKAAANRTPIKESVKQRPNLDNRRPAQRPTTTRHTLLENQDPVPAPRRSQPTTGNSIVDIAASMD